MDKNQLFRLATAGVLVSSGCHAAFAQSSIQMFGIIDSGLTYVTDVGGHSKVAATDGIQRNNFWGIQGAEDLGGGTQAIFRLENYFALNTGAIAGSAFFTDTYVGLRDKRLGQLSFGRQYDFGSNLVRYIACLECGVYSVQNADLDRAAGDHLSNTIQYKSPNFAGFTFGAMYGFGQNATGSSNLGRSYSLLAQYENGPFSGALITTNINGSPVSIATIGAVEFLGVDTTKTSTIYADQRRIFGAGASYRFGALTAMAMYTNTHFTLQSQHATDQVVRAGVTWLARPDVLFSVMETFDRLDDDRWYSSYASATYLLSKRTRVYTDLAFQKASGQGAVASIYQIGRSSTTSQGLVRIGMVHTF
ncbi:MULTISPECIES: porin [unclassified Paraburkholderia]|uniref:porin n=1 Tax=unclassified Paraburkholderia TaxID=2615204 RepID=UPI002AB1A6E3|nr:MULTISPECIES: porin [unclassified Paraburkholderia]